MGTQLSSKYGQNFLIVQKKKLTTDAIKTASKRVIRETAEATGDLIDDKTADKITTVSKRSSTHWQNNEANDESETQKERYISTEKKTTNY